MDYEDCLAATYTPLKTIECLSNIIYSKINEDWNLFCDNGERKDFDELVALNFGIKLCARYLLKCRKREIDGMYTK